MPIFQDPDRRYHPYRPWGYTADEGNASSSRTLAQPTATAENMDDEPVTDLSSQQQEKGTEEFPRLQTSNRQELIRRIKRGESPTWIPSPSLEKYFADNGDPPHLRVEGSPEKESEEGEPCHRAVDRPPNREIVPTPSYGSPRDIQRPRSALHSGDFREGSPESRPEPQPLEIPTTPACLRHSDLSSPDHWYNFERPRESFNARNDNVLCNTRVPTSATLSTPPSLGSSFSASYVLKAPTSPLVHQANNPDVDFSPRTSGLHSGSSVGKANRRSTLPSGFCSSAERFSENGTNPGMSWRRERSSPIGSHRARKSITSPYTLQLASSPQSTSKTRFEHSSFSTDGPSQHRSGPRASMVGSYEESILRGRMSTTPSKPLDFTAQIGVLGRGDCKPNLKCPSHVTVPFPAVFYSYPTSGKGTSISDESPSPYVGFIDLEKSLPTEPRPKRKSNTRRPKESIKCPCHPRNERETFSETISYQQERRVREKNSRRSQFPLSPPGGCYRIPQQGQIQIIIKNPNKTAVKLFLVPYDLEGMEPGTKTFIRQRSYSVGSLIDSPLDSPSPVMADEATGATEDRPVLRYLVHLNICCTCKDRFYLHSGIRVVFANRVPDGKERLRNEIQYPEPRYSRYRPTKDSSSDARSTSGRIFGRHDSVVGHDDQTPLSPPFRPSDQNGRNTTESQSLDAMSCPMDLSPTNPVDGNNNQQVNDWFGTPISSPSNAPRDIPPSPFPAARQLLLPPPEGPSQGDNGPLGPFNADVVGGKHHALARRFGEGESLLARKLRSLDVMKREIENQSADAPPSPDLLNNAPNDL